jgi:hypothetical protein
MNQSVLSISIEGEKIPEASINNGTVLILVTGQTRA